VRIEILGPGCARCHALGANVRKAVATLGIQADVVDVTDIQQMIAYGIMSTPAVVIDSRVVSYGRVLSPEEARKIIVAVQV
jgi:small redox-active disulfide protein 2